MKETQLATLVAALLQTQGQRELLADLLTQEQLRDVEVYQREESRLQHRRRQALRQLVDWLHRMGLADEMLQLMQCQRHSRRAWMHQAQHQGVAPQQHPAAANDTSCPGNAKGGAV